MYRAHLEMTDCFTARRSSELRELLGEPIVYAALFDDLANRFAHIRCSRRKCLPGRLMALSVISFWYLTRRQLHDEEVNFVQQSLC